MADKWWCQKQVDLSGKLVWFSWEGSPRWPGVIVPPKSKSELVNGKGQFYPPDSSVLERTFIRDYDVGTKKEPAIQTGIQKVTKWKCRETQPQGQLLV